MKNLRLLGYICFSLFVANCTKDSDSETVTPVESEVQSLYFPPIDSDSWEGISLEELNWNVSAEQELFALLTEKGTKAFIVLKNGKIAIEWYGDNFTSNTPWYWASAGKTLTSFTTGIAAEEGILTLSDKTSDYLGKGWTSIPGEKEDLITIWHQLTMTTGLDETTWDCKTPDCLTYVDDAGLRWSYHNAPYTLIQDVVANASMTTFESYFTNKLKNKIGMTGQWVSDGGNNTYWSNARSMARFGLLNLNNGVWEGTPILNDPDYLSDMKNTSQDLNKSYGYLWWLNGKESSMAPGSQLVFTTELIPNAPADLYAGLGKNDQKLYVVPSQNLVVVRMGQDSGDATLGPSSFDNELWRLISELIQ
ncbi:serine hydrolase domain-containing protein [Maribacter sp. 2307UL18-2]|uniref:serine hydrolase domain-containing protein n=1 Tax=Maribacter sp. 2307UL18-2 TaxID=3386274 RepID=UPI0039BC8BC4